MKSVLWTWMAFGQNTFLRRVQVADSTILKIYLENHVGEASCRDLFPDENQKIGIQV